LQSAPEEKARDAFPGLFCAFFLSRETGVAGKQRHEMVTRPPVRLHGAQYAVRHGFLPDSRHRRIEIGSEVEK